MAQTIYYGDYGGTLLNPIAGTVWETGFSVNQTGWVNNTEYRINQWLKTGYTTPFVVGQPVSVKVYFNGVLDFDFRSVITALTANSITTAANYALYYRSTNTITINIAPVIVDLLDSSNYFSTVAATGCFSCGCSQIQYLIPGTRFTGTYNPANGDVLVLTSDYCNAGADSVLGVNWGPNPTTMYAYASSTMIGPIQSINYSLANGGSNCVLISGTFTGQVDLSSAFTFYQTSPAFPGPLGNVIQFGSYSTPTFLGNVNLWEGAYVSVGNFAYGATVTLKLSTNTSGTPPTIAGGSFLGTVIRALPTLVNLYSSNIIRGGTYSPTAQMQLFADGSLDPSSLPTDPGFAVGGGSYLPIISFPNNIYPNTNIVLLSNTYGPTASTYTGAYVAPAGNSILGAGFP